MGDGATARSYHEATKHSPQSVRRQERTLDWDTQPEPFKEYPDAERTGLPEPEHLGTPAMDVLLGEGEGTVTTIGELARILILGAGVLRRRSHGGREILFRTYASAGALYPVEVYVVTRGLEGLESGVYHFDPRGRTLARLAGDAGGALARATAKQDAVAHAPASLVLTGIPWRTAWKYTERGYRHLFWDAGTMLANILALAASAGVAAGTVVGFDDAAVSRIVGVDGVSEFPLCVVPLGRSGDAGRAQAAALPPVQVMEEPVSYEAIRRVHRAGDLGEDDVAAWRRGGPVGGPSRAEEDGLVRLIRPGPRPDDGIERTIRRRGSARRFGPLPIPVEELTAVLRHCATPVGADVAPPSVEPFVMAHAVGGLAPGAYRWTGDGYHVLAEREMRMEGAFLCLEQRLGGEGAVTVFLLADLDAFLDVYGDRGYRWVQLVGGIVAGRLYLAFHAYGYGATGLTFYDDEVVRAFAPHSDGRQCLLVVAAGQRAGRLLPLA